MPALNSARGISLVEVLLAIAVATAMLAGAFKLMVDNQRELRAQRVAEHLQTVQQAAAEYFLLHRGEMLDAMADGEPTPRHCRIAIDENGEGGSATHNGQLHTCTLDTSVLRHAGLLPAQFSPNNAYGEQWLAIFRRIYYNNEATGHADMLLVAVQEDPLPYGTRYQDSLAVMNRLGGSGGLIPDGVRGPCVFDPAAERFDACGNGWRVNLRDFLDDNALSRIAQLITHTHR